MDRQEVLTRKDPPHFIAGIAESVIRRAGEGFRDILAGQIKHLISLAAVLSSAFDPLRSLDHLLGLGYLLLGLFDGSPIRCVP